MQIKPREIQDRGVWDSFLMTHAAHALFQSWEWGDVQKKLGQKVYRLGLYSAEECIGIAQAFVVRARRGTFLHLRHGPVWKVGVKANWRDCIRIMEPIARKEHAWFMRISPLAEETPALKGQLSALGFRSAPIHAMDAEDCWVLDIDKPEEVLLAEMRKTTRYEIRHAQKLGVRVTSSQNSRDLEKFFALYDETSRRHGFVKHLGIREEFEVFSRQKKTILYLGIYNKEVIAGAIVLFWGNQAIYHHGASRTSKIPASYRIQWEAICEAKKRGFALYNFWGIAPDDAPNHPWSGITLFKKGFGGREVRYIHAYDYAFSPLYIIPRTIETVRRIMRGY
jgi:peptidoglycan pentaglycine glycine transferase (the first glycine)